MAFLRTLLKSFLYGTVLIAVLLAAWLTYIFLFIGTTPPSDSVWASYSIDTTGFKFEYVQTNNIKLNVITAGPSTGKTVVFLHGFPETALVGWHYHIAHFAKLGYHVIAPDQRGYNTSDKPAALGDYIIDELARDIIGLLKHYGKDKVILVGHDWGAAVTFRVAMMFPERVEKLAILNVPHPKVMEETLRSSWDQFTKSWYIFFFQLPYFPELKMASDNYLFGRVAISASSVPKVSFSRDAANRLVQAWSEPGALTGMINWYRAILQRKFSLEKVSPYIESKALILWGKNDTALGFPMAEASLKYLKNGNLIPLDATHWVQHDLPDVVAKHLQEFFESS